MSIYVPQARGSRPMAAVRPVRSEGLYTTATEAAVTLGVAELAETHTFESVAALLWEADPGTVFGRGLPSAPPSCARLRRGLAELPVVEQAMALFPLIERANPRSYDLSKPGCARTGADLLRWFAAILVGANAPS